MKLVHGTTLAACLASVAFIMSAAAVPSPASALRQCGLIAFNGYQFRVRSHTTTCVAARPLALRRLKGQRTRPYRCDHPNGRGVRLFTCIGPGGRRVYISLP